MKSAGRLVRKLCLGRAGLCVALAAACATPAAFAQVATRGEPSRELKAGERLIEVAALIPRAEEDSGGLSVTKVWVGGEKVALGRPFAAGAGWLRSLTVRVRNDSTKPISYIQLHFDLPEARHPTGGVGFMFHYNVLRPGGVDAGSPQLPPGEEADLTFLGGEYESTLSLVERLCNLTDFDFTRVNIRHAHLVFADGTSGRVARPALAAPAATRGGEK